MTAVITPIPTRYAGCHFRSRLEARWAVFFDALGIAWEYEPQGFEVGLPGHRLQYLPDFYLRRDKVWVEVKGSDAMLDRSLLLAAVLPDVGLPLDPEGTPFERAAVTEPYVDRLLVLGPIPRSTVRASMYPLLCWHDQYVYRMWGMFRSKSDRRALTPPADRLGRLGSCKESDAFGGSCGHLKDPTMLGESGWVSRNPADSGDWGVITAFDKARSARFEHGECGAT